MRAFWDAAVSLDPAAADLTEVRRFPCCTREGLTALAQRAGLSAVESTALEVPAVFADFDDLWRPFTLGTGPAPGYCMSLADEARQRLRERLGDSLPRPPARTIALAVRARRYEARRVGKRGRGTWRSR